MVRHVTNQGLGLVWRMKTKSPDRAAVKLEDFLSAKIRCRRLLTVVAHD